MWPSATRGCCARTPRCLDDGVLMRAAYYTGNRGVEVDATQRLHQFLFDACGLVHLSVLAQRELQAIESGLVGWIELEGFLQMPYCIMRVSLTQEFGAQTIQ